MKADPETILRRHIVDVTRACAAFREAPTRKHSPSCQRSHFNKDIPIRSTEQTRFSDYNWNPGPRRGNASAIKRHIAGKWHNKDTFSDINVSSIYLHDTRACEQDKIKEGESGWVLQGVVSRAACRRQPRSGKDKFTVMTLHTNSNFAKESGIMQEEHVDLVAGDFNGAAWRQSNGNKSTSILEEAFADTDFPMPPGPPPLWGPGAVPGEWTEVCGFVKHPNLHDIRLHGAFTVPRETLGFRPKDQSCHHEVWLHLDFVGNQFAHEPRGNHEQRVLLKERSCSFPPNREIGR